jgi:beta-lactamase class C
MSDEASDRRNLHGITRRDLIKGGLAAGFSIGVVGNTLLGARRSAAQETGSRAETASIDTLIEDYISRTKTPGVAVALYDVSNSPAAQTFCQGYTDLKTKTPVAPDVIFELASVTKVFTATLLGYQPDIFNDKLSNHLPISVTNPNLNEVTIVELATHTSGFPAEITGEGMSGAGYLFQDQLPPHSSALAKLWRDWNPKKGNKYCDKCEVGTCWQYSDVGFVTLGYVVAGDQMNPTLKEQITGLLSMNSTGANPPPGSTVAQGYNFEDGRPKKALGIAPDLKSSANDLLIWLQAQVNPSGTGYPSLASAIELTQQTYFKHQNQCPKDEPITFNQGLAWEIDTLTFPGYTEYWKDGISSVGGQTSWVGYLPAVQLGVAVLTNMSGGKANPGSLGNAILNLRL